MRTQPKVKQDNTISTLFFSTQNEYYSERSAVQQSAFTMCNDITKDHLEAMVDILGEQSKDFLQKIIIPATIKKELLSQLRVMNITANSIFPGLDGLGKSIHELVSVRVHHNKKNMTSMYYRNRMK